ARRAAASDALARTEAALVDVAAEAEASMAQRGELEAGLDGDRARIADLEAQLPALAAEEAQAAERVTALSEARTQIEADAAAAATLRTEFEVRTAALDERRRHCQQRLAEIDERLARHTAERAVAQQRRADLEARAVAVDRLCSLVADRALVVDVELAALQERRRRQSEAAREVAAHLDGLRRSRTGEERALEETRDRARRAELDQAETRLRLEQAVESCRRDLDCEPEHAMAASSPPLPDGVSPHVRVRELERELRLMGPINPLALEEFEALTERHEFLVGQLDDVKSTRRELAKVIRAVDEEIIRVFAAAYADVADNFTRLFETLFPGGWGRLTLTDPDDLLDTGVEVEARPSGKNVKKLSLLSGGERSLTALAFLFAVFRSRPSPFYVMDEVEAALDDVNLHRFLDLVHEFRRDAQLLIVSHQKRTMEAADCLYGVTMQPGGSSKVISERVSAHA
ncbi:MAG: chromosome segregation protein SMC, partial [Acidimicrobiales bacterium]